MKTLSLQQIARKYIKNNGTIVRSNIPVKIVPDSSCSPIVKGNVAHYITKSGEKIVHPASYSVRGWSNMVYVNSTQCIEIGQNFCCNL